MPHGLPHLPIQEFSFTFHKFAFHDAFAFRYGWTPSELTVNCDCGKNFTIKHPLSCAKGGFPSLRNNEVRDITASLLIEVVVISSANQQDVQG